MITFTATEIADELNVDPKAFRSFYRSIVRSNGGKVGVNTPGSGKRYAFDLDDSTAHNDAERAALVDAYIDGWRIAYNSHRKTNNANKVSFDDLVQLGIMPVNDEPPSDDSV
jgi:hypothetical protein